MIRVSVLYPKTEGARFDHDYYATKHMPLVKSELGDGLVKAEFDKCVDGPYVAVAHLFFDSMESFQSTMGAKGGPVQADVPNYTDLAPQLSIAETHTV